MVVKFRVSVRVFREREFRWCCILLWGCMGSRVNAEETINKSVCNELVMVAIITLKLFVSLFVMLPKGISKDEVSAVNVRET